MSKTQTTTNTQDSVSTGYVATGPDYKTYIEEFGAEFAADAVNRDLTIDQARTEYIALLRSERDDLRTELQGARDDLAALTEKHDALSATFVSSGTDAVSGGNDDADDGKASEFESRKQKFQPRVGDTVGAMAAGIRLPK